MKSLSGAEIAGYMKENQAHKVRSLAARKIFPKLVIIRDSDNPVIQKYVELKQQYGEDIGVTVEDWLRNDVAQAIEQANQDETVHGVIVQLPLMGEYDLDEILAKIKPEKDVDGLATDIDGRENSLAKFDSATATAINWLLAGHDIKLDGKKIAIVGQGRLVGKPLLRMWKNSGYDVSGFHRGDDLLKLREYDVIVSATGQAGLITDEMVANGTVIVDAGTASENGVLKGDVSEEVRERTDLLAITPKVGGVGPLTVTALFEHVLMAAEK